MPSKVTLCAVLLAGSLVARDAQAQCGANHTSCSACHDGTRASAPSHEAWHENHAFADLCPVCHGGRGDVNSLAEAHVGLVAPLGNVEEQCGSCHGASTQAFAERYRAARVVEKDGGPPALVGGGASQPPPRPPLAIAPRPHGAPGSNFLLSLLIVVVGALGVAFTGRLRAMRLAIRRPWSPYVAGVGLGLVVTISMGLFGHRLSGAGAYQHLSGFFGRRSAPESIYWRHVVPTGLTWDVLVLIGSLLGAFAASMLAGQFKLRTMPDGQWTDAFGPSVARRWLFAFIGSVLTEVGGGIAGGCTASLAVSGGAVLAPAAFLFMAGMFSGGIPTALLIYRKARS